ncbi:hypothetical protein [Phyllobacterium sp. SB3]|uniref:hypothetical protein n=1 Tax=Phyllobacterium sp. SB3 TaxID=3156073 RepID=UPI0032AF3054
MPITTGTSQPVGNVAGSTAEVLDRVVATGLAEVFFCCIVARQPDRLATSLRVDEIFAEDRA